MKSYKLTYEQLCKILGEETISSEFELADSYYIEINTNGSLISIQANNNSHKWFSTIGFPIGNKIYTAIMEM